MWHYQFVKSNIWNMKVWNWWQQQLKHQLKHVYHAIEIKILRLSKAWTHLKLNQAYFSIAFLAFLGPSSFLSPLILSKNPTKSFGTRWFYRQKRCPTAILAVSRKSPWLTAPPTVKIQRLDFQRQLAKIQLGVNSEVTTK